MSIEIRIDDKTPELMQKIEAAIGRFVVKGAVYIEGQIKVSMAESKSGHVYPRGKEGVHVASAPGESPAIDSSNLTGSIMTTIAENRLEAKIGTPVEYALWLEEGTEKMEARPVWEPVGKRSLPILERILAEEIGKVH